MNARQEPMSFFFSSSTSYGVAHFLNYSFTFTQFSDGRTYNHFRILFFALLSGAGTRNQREKKLLLRMHARASTNGDDIRFHFFFSNFHFSCRFAITLCIHDGPSVHPFISSSFRQIGSDKTMDTNRIYSAEYVVICSQRDILCCRKHFPTKKSNGNHFELRRKKPKEKKWNGTE